MKFSIKNIQILRLIRPFLTATGFFFVLLTVLAFTTLPFHAYHWLGTSRSVLSGKPGVIILLGGSGMPSGSNLMRAWYAALAAKEFPDSKVLVVMPGDTEDKSGTPLKIEQELVSRGVDPSRINFESRGTNTRSQALECARLLSADQSILLITAPENMRRTVLTFKKAGFTDISSLPAFENASEADFTYKDEELGKRPVMVPPVGRNTQIRYQVWNHLIYEVIVAREMTALLYYRLRGWI